MESGTGVHLSAVVCCFAICIYNKYNVVFATIIIIYIRTTSQTMHVQSKVSVVYS